MRKTLSHLIHCCQGDHRLDCPILEDLARAGTHSQKRDEREAPTPRAGERKAYAAPAHRT